MLGFRGEVGQLRSAGPCGGAGLLFLQKEGVIDELVRRDGDTLLLADADYSPVPIFELAGFAIANVPLHRGSSIGRRRIEDAHRVCDSDNAMRLA